tara:strand:+ start:748 stop:1806 length:1059 start_codon:yes stop_codon:yes gene_type:complete
MNTGTRTMKGKVKHYLEYYNGGVRKTEVFKTASARNKRVAEIEKGGRMLQSLGEGDRYVVSEALKISRRHEFSLLDAARKMAGIKENSQSPLISELLPVFLKVYRGRVLNKRSRDSVEQVLNMLNALHGHENCRNVDAAMIESFVTGRENSPCTNNNYLRRLNRFFAWAKKQGYIKENPVKDVESFAQGQAEPETMSPEDVRKLMDWSKSNDKALMVYFAIGFFSGARVAEIERLKLTDINVKDRIITVRRSKTGRKRNLTINDTLARFLEISSELDFRNLRKRKRVALKATGVKWAQNIMRHSFASYHVATYRNPVELALEMGHIGNVRVLYDHYLDASIHKESGNKYWNL